MNKNIRNIIIVVIAVVAGYAAYYIFTAVKYSHKLDWKETPKEYLWLFKDSIRSGIDTNLRYSYIQKNDTYNSYNYKHKYYISVWEFKNLKSINLKEIPVNRNVDLENIKFGSGETINVHSVPEITIKFGFNFHNTLQVNLDPASKIDSSFESNDYKGFYGTINKMSFSNEQGKHLILFNYVNGKEHSLFILYKAHQSFYLLMIDSDNPFDAKKLIKIFNLS